MRAFSRIAGSVALLLLLAAALAAEQSGEIRGRITDESGAVLPGVLVTARGPNLQGTRTASSDTTGFFRLALLPVGTYALTFELQGFESVTLTENEVRLGFTTSVSVAMKISPVREQITVKAENVLVDATKSDTSYRLRGEELARLPAQGRTIAEIVGFTPGVTGVRVNTVTGTDTGLPSFRGEGDSGNNWLVDGLPVKGVNYNDSGVRINYDAWDEVQIISDGFAPELGQAMGGFVNVVTKSGGNTFHGDVGTLIRDKNLRAGREPQLSAASLPETSNNQYFGNLGGPILKDRLWFFLSDNYISTVDQTSNQSVGWLDIPAGKRTTATNNAFAKLTFTPRENHTISLSGTVEDSPRQPGGIGVPATYAAMSSHNSVLRLNYAGIFRPNLFITAVAGQNRRDDSTVPQSGDYGPPSYYWEDIGQQTSNIMWGQTESERRADAALSADWLLDAKRWGRHEIKAGVSYYDNGICNTYNWTGRNADPFPGDGFDGGVSVTWTAPGVPLSLLEFQTGRSKDSTRGFGAFLQDTVTFDRVTFMLGLRADTQQIFNDAGERLWSWGPGDFLQPRASLAVDLSGNGRTVLKAGYGQFAMPVSTAVLAFFNRTWMNASRTYLWTGPENPTSAQLKDPANWQFVFEQSPTGSPEGIDPSLKPDRVERILVGLERRISTGWALKLRGVYSHSSGLIEDVGLYAPGTPSEYKFLLTNFNLKRRDYRAVELELNGRVGGKLFLDASYTWSRARGTVPGNFYESGTWGVFSTQLYDLGEFGDHPKLPAGDPNKALYDSLFGGLGGPGIGDEGWYGYLPYSVDHDVKVLVTCVAPRGFRITSNIEWLSGYHWEKRGLSAVYGDYSTFPEGRGGRTTPAHAYLDFALDKEFQLGSGLAVDAGVNVYNLLNSQRPVSYVKQDTELFGQVWARQLPRWVQLKAGLRF
jgi:hypothetical protein